MSSEIWMPPGILAQLCPLVAEGMTDYEIAQQLSCSEDVISNSVAWLVKAFDVANRVELLLYFLCAADQDRRFAPGEAAVVRGPQTVTAVLNKITA
jgi:Bacterial regulatory proteins, luxR family